MVEVDGLIPPELVAELAKSAKMVRGRSSLFRICLKWWAAEPLLPRRSWWIASPDAGLACS